MRPVRNQVFCLGCHKSKMLFETQSKANNFMKFNSEGILEENGKAPVRSYYCEFCGGYHVTSNPSVSEGERLDTRDTQKIQQLEFEGNQRKLAGQLHGMLSAKLMKIRYLLCCGLIDEAQDLIDVCSFELDDFFEQKNSRHGSLLGFSSKLTTFRQKLEETKTLLSYVEKIDGGVYVDIQDLPIKTSQKTMLSNVSKLKRIRDMMDEATSLAKDGAKVDALIVIENCKELLETVRGEGRKAILQYYQNQFEELVKKIQGEDESSGKETSSCSKQPAKQKKNKSNYIDKETYRKTILELLERLDGIKNSYEAGDYENCLTMIDVGFMIIEELGVDDKNVKLIKRQFENWENNLSAI